MHLHFSDEKKRQLYDEYGSFGLYIADQVGDEFVGSVMMVQSGWFKVSQKLLYLLVLIVNCHMECVHMFCKDNVDNDPHSVLTLNMIEKWKNVWRLF